MTTVRAVVRAVVSLMDATAARALIYAFVLAVVLPLYLIVAVLS